MYMLTGNISSDSLIRRTLYKTFWRQVGFYRNLLSVRASELLPNQDAVERSLLESSVPERSYPTNTPPTFSNNHKQKESRYENARETRSRNEGATCFFLNSGEIRNISTSHVMSALVKSNYLVFSHIMTLHIIGIQFNISNSDIM